MPPLSPILIPELLSSIFSMLRDEWVPREATVEAAWRPGVEIHLGRHPLVNCRLVNRYWSSVATAKLYSVVILVRLSAVDQLLDALIANPSLANFIKSFILKNLFRSLAFAQRTKENMELSKKAWAILALLRPNVLQHISTEIRCLSPLPAGVNVLLPCLNGLTSLSVDLHGITESSAPPLTAWIVHAAATLKHLRVRIVNELDLESLDLGDKRIQLTRLRVTGIRCLLDHDRFRMLVHNSKLEELGYLCSPNVPVHELRRELLRNAPTLKRLHLTVPLIYEQLDAHEMAWRVELLDAIQSALRSTSVLTALHILVQQDQFTELIVPSLPPTLVHLAILAVQTSAASPPFLIDEAGSVITAVLQRDLPRLRSICIVVPVLYPQTVIPPDPAPAWWGVFAALVKRGVTVEWTHSFDLDFPPDSYY